LETSLEYASIEHDWLESINHSHWLRSAEKFAQ